jgi:hypothetical protein
MEAREKLKMKDRNNTALIIGIVLLLNAAFIGMDRVIKNSDIRLCIDLIVGLILLAGWWFGRKNK